MAKNKMTKNKKIYVLDTNVLINNPHALFSFDEHTVVIPDVVLDELDKHKKDSRNDVAENVRIFNRLLKEIREDIAMNPNKGNLLDGYKLKTGGTLLFEMNCVETKMPETWEKNNDYRILRVAKGLTEKYKQDANTTVILVTNDGYMGIKAAVLNIAAEEYKTDMAPMPDEMYKGRRIAYTTSPNIDNFKKNGIIDISELKYYDENNEEIQSPPIEINEYVVLKSNDGGNSSLVTFFDGNGLVLLKDIDENIPYDVKAKNIGQKLIADAFSRSAEEAPLVIVRGPAGTGKTLLAVAEGLRAVMDEHKYKRILYLRSNVKDEDIGFLPGTEAEKMDWALRPVRDNLEVIFHFDLETEINTNKKKIQ